MADEENGNGAAKGKMPMMIWLGLLAGLTLLAGGGGAGLGFYLMGQAATMSGASAKPAPADAEAAHIENTNVRDLAPIITNLDQTSDTWVRLHVAIVFDPAAVEKPDVMAAEIATDILGYMQTLSIAQLSGSSGLQHLREDLNDRAIVRSDGRVRELVIESLVVQ